jgi:hypothetical protein
MGASGREFLHFRMETQDYMELPPDVRGSIDLLKVEHENESYPEDELWCNLKSESIRSYKALKNREYDLRMKLNKK